MPCNLLIISSEFNYSCGLSKHVYLLLKELANDNNYRLHFITNGGDALEKLENLKLNLKVIKYKRGDKNPINFFYFFLELLIYCIKNNIKVIHSHHRLPEFASVLVAQILKLRTITTVHSLVEGLKYFSFKSDHIIAVSHSVERQLIDNFQIDKKKISVMYNFIENDFSEKNKNISEIKNKFGISNSDLIITYIGRICFQKGTDVLINAFKHIDLHFTNVKLILVGNIEDDSFLSMISSNQNVIYVGILKETADIYSLSTIIVQPSREESFGLIMLEAGLMQKALVSSRTGGIAEFIEDELDGLLAEPGNVNDLSEKIMKLLNDEYLRDYLAYNLNKKTLKLNHSISYMEKLIKIYEA